MPPEGFILRAFFSVPLILFYVFMEFGNWTLKGAVNPESGRPISAFPLSSLFFGLIGLWLEPWLNMSAKVCLTISMIVLHGWLLRRFSRARGLILEELKAKEESKPPDSDNDHYPWDI